MTKNVAPLLRRIVGRLNKVRVVRYLLLMGFAAFLVYLSPTLTELLTASNWSELDKIFQANQLLPYIVALPFVVLGLMLLFVHKIDKWETAEQDAKDDKRHQELLDAIKGINQAIQELINEIRNDRNERNNKPKQ